MKALVTGCGALLGQGIVKSLLRSQLDVEIIGADPSPLSPGLFWADRGYTVPFASDPAFLDRIEQVIELEKPDILFVGTDVELPVFAAERESLEAKHEMHVLVSSPAVVAIADDKYATFQFLQQAGLDPPLSALPEDEEELESLLAKVGFPVVVKPRVGARSVGVSIANSADELRSALASRSGLVVQQVAGPETEEYTASALVFGGEPRASIVMRRDLRDGNTHRAYVEPFEALNLFVRRAAAKLNPYGPVNFQFRTDASGRPRIFEINARFSGATPLRALAGFNEVEMCLRHLILGEPVIPPPAVRYGTILRPIGEEFVTEAQIEALDRTCR